MNSSRTFKSKRHKNFYFSRILFIEGSLLRNVRKLVTFFKITVNRQKKNRVFLFRNPFWLKKRAHRTTRKKKEEIAYPYGVAKLQLVSYVICLECFLKINNGESNITSLLHQE